MNADRELQSRTVEAESLEDETDLRDLYYQPALLALPAVRYPDFLPPDRSASLIEIRDQGNTGHCTGHALAAVIDLLRIDRSASDRDAERAPAVSAGMLFHMGRLVSHYGRGRAETRLSIRSTLKGFYHNGVCLESVWPSTDPTDCTLSVERSKNAREIGLGTYYRLQQHLPHYHSALVEADAILVSSHIHNGWATESVRRHGRIKPAADTRGAHAFVIVGYDHDGFHVLNSWGAGWGGRRADDGLDTPGIARWAYEDWADNVIDAWVLRLSVPTPGAFDFSIGTQGRRYGYLAGRGATANGPGGRRGTKQPDSIPPPRRYVLGHYLHWADGDFVVGGSYPDSDACLASTIDHLGHHLATSRAPGHDGPAERVYLRITGDTGDVKDAMQRVALLRRRLRPKHVYPMSIVWCAGLGAAFSTAIGACMREAGERMPEPSDDRDDLIESLLRPIGRALWQQMQQEAAKVGANDGPVWTFIDRLNERLDESIYERRDLDADAAAPAIDLVVEGTGALPFIAMLDAANAEAAYRLRHVRRIHLLFPAARTECLEAALARSARHYDASVVAMLAKFRIYPPAPDLLARLSIGVYRRSWFHLVNDSFDAERLDKRAERLISLQSAETIARETKYLRQIAFQPVSVDVSRQAARQSSLRWHALDDGFVQSVVGR